MPELPIILVGCNADLRHNPEVIGEFENTPVSREQAEAVRSETGAYKYLV